MSLDVAERKLPGDWHDGSIPPNVTPGASAQIETSYSFAFYRSELAEGLSLGEATTVYLGCMFVIGARSVVMHDVPPYTLAAGNPARVIRRIENDELPAG